MKCSVFNCESIYSSKDSSISFFYFPKDENLLRIWLEFCQRTEQFNHKSWRMCSKHFSSDALLPSSCPTARPRLQKNSVPTILPAVISNESIDDLKELLKQQIKQNRSQERDIKKKDFQIAILEEQLENCKLENQCLHDAMNKVFTVGQIQHLISDKKPHWNEVDISNSITLYSASPRGYKFLKKRGFPLPHQTTLNRWATKINIQPGILEPVMKLLKSTKEMTSLQKLCVLSFDEMKIRKAYCYDSRSDTTIAPKNYVQVGMLRGLASKWKQPLYYDFDCAITKETVFTTIKSVKDVGYNVVALVNDLGGTNRAFFNSLDITAEKPWFSLEEQKIYVFADVPHLIKLMRNHFVDSGFMIDGKCIKKSIIQELLSITSSDITITHKISEQNLNVRGAERQKVKFATKLFSHTVAKAITRAASLGHLKSDNSTECSLLFKTVNDWFDVMNVRVPRQDSRTRLHAYGLHLEEQDEILNEMCDLISNMRVIGKNTLLPFQRGILQSTRAIQMLFADLKGNNSAKYILTYNLNQDVLENFFGLIRSRGGLHDHPDQQEFKYRLRSYLLGKNEGALRHGANVSDDNTPDITCSGLPLTASILRPLNIMEMEDELNNLDESIPLDDLEYDSIEYLAGYICRRLRRDIPTSCTESASSSYTWITHLSEGGLVQPSEEMTNYLVQCENVFKELNNEKLLITKGYMKMHMDRAVNINCNDKIKKLFFRSRMYFAIKKLNRLIVEDALKKKRKTHKTTD